MHKILIEFEDWDTEKLERCPVVRQIFFFPMIPPEKSKVTFDDGVTRVLEDPKFKFRYSHKTLEMEIEEIKFTAVHLPSRHMCKERLSHRKKLEDKQQAGHVKAGTIKT